MVRVRSGKQTGRRRAGGGRGAPRSEERKRSGGGLGGEDGEAAEDEAAGDMETSSCSEQCRR